jgi:hypothetical protein
VSIVITEKTRSLVNVINESPERLVIQSIGIQGPPGVASENIDGGTANSVYGGLDPIDPGGA